MAEPPLYREVSKTCKKKAGTMADSIYTARRPTHPRTARRPTHSHTARRPSMTYKARRPTTGGLYTLGGGGVGQRGAGVTFVSSEGRGRRRGWRGQRPRLLLLPSPSSSLLLLLPSPSSFSLLLSSTSLLSSTPLLLLSSTLVVQGRGAAGAGHHRRVYVRWRSGTGVGPAAAEVQMSRF